MEKYGIVGETTDENMAYVYAHCVLGYLRLKGAPQSYVKPTLLVLLNAFFR